MCALIKNHPASGLIQVPTLVIILCLLHTYCRGCCLIILPPGKGWDIMRCESEPLPSQYWLRNRPYSIDSIHYYIFLSFFLFLYPSSAWPLYWSHQWRNLIYPSLLSSRIHSSNMAHPEMYSAIVAFCLLTYYNIGYNPVTSRSVATVSHFHLLSSPHLVVSPASLRPTLWCNTSSTVIIASITTHLSHPYRNTVWTTALYSIACAYIAGVCDIYS